MSDPIVTATEEVNGVTLQLLEDGHVGFPTAMSADASDQEFYLRKSVVRCRVERSLLWEITGSLAAAGNDSRVGK